MRIMGIILRSLGRLLLLALAAVAWLSVLRAGFNLQYAAQLIVEFVGPLMLLILLVGAVLSGLRWRRRGGRLDLAMMLLAASGALAGGRTIGGYVMAARSHGIAVNPIRALWPSLPMREDAGGQAFVYDRYQGEPARLYVYQPAATSRAPRPILVYVHGGGWVQGSNSQRERDLRWFADQGYLVIGIDYALSSASRHLWDVTQPQIACALARIAGNAARFGGDPARIAMFGESAGGNLALNVANLANAGRLASRCGGKVPSIAAVVPIYPPIDVVNLAMHPPATQYAMAYIGGLPPRFADRYAAVSPTQSMDRANPPALILTGLDDSLVPVAGTLRYVERAKAAGARIDLIAIPRAGHGFDALPGSIGNQIVRAAMLRFLAEHALKP